MVSVEIIKLDGTICDKFEHINKITYRKQVPGDNNIVELSTDEDILTHEFRFYNDINFYSDNASYKVEKKMIGELKISKE